MRFHACVMDTREECIIAQGVGQTATRQGISDGSFYARKEEGYTALY